MVTKTVRITNKLGLHARPSAKVVQTATQFASDIMLEKEGLEVNGKSIMGVMMLAAEAGSEVTIKADGSDEEEAADVLAKLLSSKFD